MTFYQVFKGYFWVSSQKCTNKHNLESTWQSTGCFACARFCDPVLAEHCVTCIAWQARIISASSSFWTSTQPTYTARERGRNNQPENLQASTHALNHILYSDPHMLSPNPGSVTITGVACKIQPQHQDWAVRSDSVTQPPSLRAVRKPLPPSKLCRRV